MSRLVHGWIDAGRNPFAVEQNGRYYGARAGPEVILTGRDDRKGQSAVEKISREVTGAKVSYEHLDLASLASGEPFRATMRHGRVV